MFLSASQIKMVYPVWHPDKEVSDQTECEISWYNKYVKKLPVPPFKATKMGSVVHSCIENFLNGGDVQDAEIYPPGWDKGLNTNEIDTVKDIITRGIDEGHIIKYDQREIEAPMSDGKDNTALLKRLKPNWNGELINKFAPATWEIVPGVLLNGYIDLIHEGNKIKDWKTSSNPQRYGLNIDENSLKFVGHDVQLLIYATWLKMIRKVEGPITVSHTYFQTKNGDTIREASAIITEETIALFYIWLVKTVIPRFQELNKLSDGVAQALPHGEEACKKYSGCPYQNICSGKLTEGEYRRTHKIENGVKKKKPMGLFNKIKTTEDKKVTAPVGNNIKEGLIAERVGEIVDEAVSKLEVVAEKVDEQAELKAKAAAEVAAKKAEIEAAAQEKPVDDLATIKEDIANDRKEAEAEKAEATEKVEEAKAEVKEKKRGTIKFNLIIGAHVVKGYKATYIQDLFNEITSEMAEKMNVTSWYDLDPFRRKEFFQQHKESIIAGLHGKTIVANHTDHEVRPLLNVLCCYATVIVEATAGL